MDNTNPRQTPETDTEDVDPNGRCYHCGRTFASIEADGCTIGCLCDPTPNEVGR